MKQLPNIQNVAADGRAATYHSKLMPLLEKVAVAKPHWRFTPAQLQTGRDPETSETTYVARGVKVFHGDQELGRFSEANTWRKDTYLSVFMIANDRIAKERKRGRVIETANMMTAFNLITKKFHRDTPEETLDAVLKAANNVMHYHTTTTYDKYRDAQNRIFGPQLIEFIHNNIGIVKQHFIDRGEMAVVSYLEKLKDYQKDYVNSFEFAQKIKADENYLVVPYEGKYLVKHLDTVQFYDDTTLPEFLKRNVGLLKLVEKDTFIPDVGCKVSTEAFVVYGETQ